MMERSTTLICRLRARSLALRIVLGDGADLVEAGGLGSGRRGLRRRALVDRPFQANALFQQLRREVGRPGPASDREVYLGLLRRDAHLLAAAPGDGADIEVAAAHGLHQLGFALLDLVDRVGNLVAENLGRAVQALGML